MQKLGRIDFRSTLLLAFALLATGNEQKHTQQSIARPSIFEIEHSCKATEGSLRTEDLTVLDFRIGSSTIGDVQKRFPGIDPVELTKEEEAETGICIKNQEGEAVIFATSVMGAPKGTLTSIYLAPAVLVERARLTCKSVKLPPKMFSSKSCIRVGATAAQVSKLVRAKLPTEGSFCTAYEIASSQGLLQENKSAKLRGFTDSTGAEGDFSKGKLEWIKLFGITSN